MFTAIIIGRPPINAVDTLVHSSLPGRNHSGNGRLQGDSDRPRVEVDYLADNVAPQFTTGYPGDSDLGQGANLRHGDADHPTTAVRRPYY